MKIEMTKEVCGEEVLVFNSKEDFMEVFQAQYEKVASVKEFDTVMARMNLCAEALEQAYSDYSDVFWRDFKNNWNENVYDVIPFEDVWVVTKYEA